MLKIIILLLLIISPSFAYLDPGTGSMLLYFIMGVIATFIYFIKGVYYKVKAFILGGKIDKGLRDLEGIDILFYSEGGNYWNVFLPVIEALETMQIKSAYYTASTDDPGLETSFQFLRSRFIGNDLSAFTLLNHIKVKVMVMTTPQLDIMHLKRSKYVNHYVHLIHAPTDALIYKKFAFDYFDSVMCSGLHQIESIRLLEIKRNLPVKVLFKTGLTYYDVMSKNKEKYLKEKDKIVVLIAPTWGSNGMLEKFDITFIKVLLDEDYEVILRPHPQMYVSQKELMTGIEKELKVYTNLTIDTNISGEESMGKADILISDVSGIIFDFMFVFEKPVVVIESKLEKGGLEAEDVEKEIWESMMIRKHTISVNHDSIISLPEIIRDTLVSENIIDMRKIRDESLFNFAIAGNVAAKQIIEIIGR